MEKVFVHRYKWSHHSERKKYRRLLKEGKVTLLEKVNDGFLYGVPNDLPKIMDIKEEDR